MASARAAAVNSLAAAICALGACLVARSRGHARLQKALDLLLVPGLSSAQQLVLIERRQLGDAAGRETKAVCMVSDVTRSC